MSYITPAQLKQVVQAQKNYTDDAGFMKNIGFYNNLVPTASQSVSKVIIDGVTYYTLGGLSNVKEGYAYYVGEVNNVHYWDTFVCLKVVSGTALFWPFRTISGSVPNNATAHYHVFATDGSGNNITIKYAVDPAIGTGAIIKRDANGRAQVSNPFANLDIANKQYVDNKTYTTSIATSSGTNQLTLAFGTKYALTAGGTSYVFTMPSNPNTNQTVKVGSTTFGANAAVAIAAGTRITVTPNATNNTITIATSATADSAITNAQIDGLF